MQLWIAAGGEWTRPAGDPLLRRGWQDGGATSALLQTCASATGSGTWPGYIYARRAPLGRRSAHRHRRTRLALARRADWHGGQPALPGRRDFGNKGLRQVVGVAELGVHPTEFDRRAGRAEAVRQRLKGTVHLGESVTGRFSHYAFRSSPD